MRPPEKKRLPRVEQEQAITVHEDENSHLWAVSYSDFLMALLSFFILFFSMDTPQRKNLVLELAETFSATGTEDGLSGRESRMPAGLADALKDMKLETSTESDSLTVHFANDFFPSGGHEIAASNEPAIIGFLRLLEPYRGKVNLYFEGHADRAPLRVKKSDIIVDNFILSSLRAASALRIARERGFPENQLFIRAASSNLRDTRSLSILIEPRAEEVKR